MTLERPIKLQERSDLFWTLVATIDAYLLRQRGSKSGHKRVRTIASNLIRLFEYAWLNGYYRLEQMPKEGWEKMFEKIAAGGWVHALDIDTRTTRLIPKIANDLESYYYLSAAPEPTLGLKQALLDQLGTNIRGRELKRVRALIQQVNARPQLGTDSLVNAYTVEPLVSPTEGALLDVMDCINLLTDCPQPWRLTFTPAPYASAYAQRHGRREARRTPNFQPEHLALLLTHSYDWVIERGPAIVSFVAAVAHAFQKTRQIARRYDATGTRRLAQHNYVRQFKQTFESLEEKKAAERAIGRPIQALQRSNKRGVTNLFQVLNQLYFACFVIIASMNARRKDELIHRAIGLHLDGVSVVDDRLGIFQCEFYIEKSIRDYVPFFINDITREALEIMSRLAEITWSWSAIVNREFAHPSNKRDRKLFVLPDFAETTKSGHFWFEFGRSPGKAIPEFFSEAFGEGVPPVHVTPHMFRRAYGLIFHYRYENATLVALAQKYGHLNTGMTLHYLTDDAVTAVGQSAASLWSAPARVVHRAHAEHVVEARREMAAAGREKLRAFVGDVVSGSKKFSGGFARLVTRFHRVLGAQLQYASLDQETQVRELGNTLLARGHMPHPYKHTTCMAGQNHKLAACTAEGGVLRRERSSPVVCSKCPYSATVIAHLSSLENDERHLTRLCSDESAVIKKQRLKTELDGLRRVIQLHKARLGV
ncbi:hypothetical protein [Variovorax paradoxus]|uniref:hypothetical protein n=1 Tax=Variovorax paradoxus TaxID=34073 RepID=UPI003391D0E7